MEVDIEVEKISANPFLRYVGGKRWFVKNWTNLLPSHVENYYEPFLGSGATYFDLKSRGVITNTSFLSDVNSHLINCYNQINYNLAELINALYGFKNTKTEFYKIRSLNPKTEIESAARFLFLNRTAFGGIYRENKRGQYNVPYGNRRYKNLFDYHNLRNTNTLLNSNTVISNSSFVDLSFNSLSEGDFFCFDPPYLGDDDNFNRYHHKKFDEGLAIKLKETVHHVSSYSKFILFVGNDMTFARQFESIGEVMILNRSSNLSRARSTNKREILIKNY